MSQFNHGQDDSVTFIVAALRYVDVQISFCKHGIRDPSARNATLMLDALQEIYGQDPDIQRLIKEKDLELLRAVNQPPIAPLMSQLIASDEVDFEEDSSESSLSRSERFPHLSPMTDEEVRVFLKQLYEDDFRF